MLVPFPDLIMEGFVTHLLDGHWLLLDISLSLIFSYM